MLIIHRFTAPVLNTVLAASLLLATLWTPSESRRSSTRNFKAADNQELLELRLLVRVDVVTNAGTEPLLSHSPVPGLPPANHTFLPLLLAPEGISLPQDQPGHCILGHAITGTCVNFQEPLSPLSVGFPVPGPSMGPSALPLSSEGQHELPYVPSEVLTASKTCCRNKTSWSYPNHALEIETFFTATVHRSCKELTLASFHGV